MTEPQSGVQLNIGDLVDGRYELVEEIGEGGFATVYRARQRVIDREIALKVLHIIPNPRKAKTFAERFAHEARIAAQIHHSNVVTIFDFGFAGPLKQPYIAMELLDGHGIDEELRLRGRVAPARALRLMHAALDAVRVGHERGVVHKDLKPGNLFLCKPSTPDEQVKVLDFGVARLASEASSHTATGEVIGTPQYLAPEYILEQVVSPAFDVYQMGLILVEILTGQKVVPGLNPYGCAMRHAEGKLDVPDVLRNGHLGPFLQRALARHPAQRFGDAGEMMVALSRVDSQRVAEDLARGYVAANETPDESRPATAPLRPDEGWVNRVSDRGTPLDAGAVGDEKATDVLPALEDDVDLLNDDLEDDGDEHRTEVHSAADVLAMLSKSRKPGPDRSTNRGEPPPWADARLFEPAEHRENAAKSDDRARREARIAEAVADGVDRFSSRGSKGESGPFTTFRRGADEAKARHDGARQSGTAVLSDVDASPTREREVHGQLVPEVHKAATRVANPSDIKPSRQVPRRQAAPIDMAALASARAKPSVDLSLDRVEDDGEVEKATEPHMSTDDIKSTLERRVAAGIPVAASGDAVLWIAVGLLAFAIVLGVLVALL